jgi:hypothetical protein
MNGGSDLKHATGSGSDPKHAAEMDPDSDAGQVAVALAYQRFEPRAYLRNNYAPPRGDLSNPDGVGPWKLRCMAQVFATGEHRKRRHERAELMGKGAYLAGTDRSGPVVLATRDAEAWRTT